MYYYLTGCVSVVHMQVFCNAIVCSSNLLKTPCIWTVKDELPLLAALALSQFSHFPPPSPCVTPHSPRLAAAWDPCAHDAVTLFFVLAALYKPALVALYPTSQPITTTTTPSAPFRSSFLSTASRSSSAFQAKMSDAMVTADDKEQLAQLLRLKLDKVPARLMPAITIDEIIAATADNGGQFPFAECLMVPPCRVFSTSAISMLRMLPTRLLYTK
ncbi:unnamed protein product [Periconia digitata]|uniref:Uncharacterized protein n=1 Tax=Periconia digitata TaxID=1303443 RepID=A0A9W4XVK3_9PLEO|nr:unnamed protein product [Periconia digitata]